MINSRTQRRIEIEYEFYLDGTGTRTIREDSGDLCSGAARLYWVDQSRIRIESELAPCRSGSKFPKERIDCQPSRSNQPAACLQIDAEVADEIVLVPMPERGASIDHPRPSVVQ
jgi:hypothetical protein